METQVMTLSCETCGEETKHRVEYPTPTLHLTLTILTLGLWLIVWALLSKYSTKLKCVYCGTVEHEDWPWRS